MDKTTENKAVNDNTSVHIKTFQNTTPDELIDEVITTALPDCTPEVRAQFHAKLRKTYDELNIPKYQKLGVKKATLDAIYEDAYQLFQTGKYSDALILFASLIVLNPEDSKLFMAVGSCHHKLKHYEEAANAYVAAFTLEPKNPMPFFYIGDCYIQLNQPRYAYFAFGAGITLAGDDPNYSQFKKRAQLTLASLEPAINSTAKAGPMPNLIPQASQTKSK